MATTTKTTRTTTGTTSGRTNGAANDAFALGAGFVQENMQKAFKGYDAVANFSRNAMDAYLQSAQLATKSIETLNAEAFAFSKQSIEDTVTATKAAMGCKTIEEVYSVNTDFAKTTADAYWTQMTKMGELFGDAMRETWQPLAGQYQEFVKSVQSGTAA